MKNKQNLVAAIGAYLGLVAVLTAILGFFRSPEEFFFNLAASIILTWIVTLVVYYIWAIYFYNVNMGWEDEDWKKLDDVKQELGKGDIHADEPVKNPHEHETLGLPPGTVRGTIALSMLVAGLAVVIASFQMGRTYDANQYYVDNFEFFKTAFLMMIAFYFGNKSLQAISSRNQGVYGPQGSAASTINPVSSTPKPKQDTTIVTPISTDQAGQAKRMLKTGHNPETTDTGDATDFDQKGAVG
ncbi:MAG: hypothetical protein KI790_03715 [Cyclobacteriaceae bacterium]|nr:hypothetical protein [Cyclobacteriaceae bacterium HetDA_MAG_MS6]